MSISPASWWGTGSGIPLEPVSTKYGPRPATELASSVLSIEEIRKATALEEDDAEDAEVIALEESAIKEVEDLCGTLLRSRNVIDYYERFASIMRVSARIPQDRQMGQANFVNPTVAVMEEVETGYVDTTYEWHIDYSGSRVAVTFDTIPSYSWSREIALPVRIGYTYTPIDDVAVPSRPCLLYTSPSPRD